jgi:hypothetical protein
MISNIQALRTRQNAECIYWEKAIIVHARLSEVHTNDWGVTLTFQDLRTPGFASGFLSSVDDSSWTVSSSWETFSYRPESWAAAYVSWSVYFGPALIESLCATARSCAEADSLLRHEALVNAFRNALSTRAK